MKRLLPKDPPRTWNHPEKRRIARDMLARYTGCDPRKICKHIIITNFEYYVERFAYLTKSEIHTGSAMSIANDKANDVSILEFNIGAPMSALVIEMLSSIAPRAVLMLGMCGGLHRDLKIGDLFLPMAAIRDEGTTGHFFPDQVPSLPTFTIQKFVSQVIVDRGLKYDAGVVHSTDYRFWEFDDSFKLMLKLEKAGSIDMECAALFISAFASKVPCGALLLVSDLPLKKVKTQRSATKIFRKYTDLHLDIGIESMNNIEEGGDHIRHFSW